MSWRGSLRAEQRRLDKRIVCLPGWYDWQFCLMPLEAQVRDKQSD
jgi:hypothetical protein